MLRLLPRGWTRQRATRKIRDTLAAAQRHEALFSFVVIAIFAAPIFFRLITNFSLDRFNTDNGLETALTDDETAEWVFWDMIGDTLTGHIDEISGNEIGKDIMQLIFMYYTDGQIPVARSSWCHGSVVHINDEKQEMNLLTCKHCEEEIVSAFRRIPECKDMFPGAYYYLLGVVLTTLWIGGIWLVFGRWYRTSSVLSIPTLLFFLLSVAYAYFSYSTVEIVGYENGITQCRAKIGEPWLCACPLSDIDPSNYHGDATEACVDYCESRDPSTRCDLYSLSQSFDQAFYRCNKTDNAVVVELDFCPNEMKQIHIDGSFTTYPSLLYDASSYRSTHSTSDPAPTSKARKQLRTMKTLFNHLVTTSSTKLIGSGCQVYYDAPTGGGMSGSKVSPKEATRYLATHYGLGDTKDENGNWLSWNAATKVSTSYVVSEISKLRGEIINPHCGTCDGGKEHSTTIISLKNVNFNIFNNVMLSNSVIAVISAIFVVILTYLLYRQQ